MRPVLMEVAERLRDNNPYHHPLYVGQMLKPPHPVARLAHALAMYLNPNNHALDGGWATSAMEKESVARLAAMFGWESHLGHLSGGGTMANFEALWVGRELRRARRWRPPRRPITPTRGSRPSWASHLSRSPSTPAAAWRLTP